MTLQVILTEPKDLGGVDAISIKAEDVMYSVSNPIKTDPVAMMSEAQQMQVNGGSVQIDISGIISGTNATTDLAALLTAAKEWWWYTANPVNNDLTDKTNFPKISWRGKEYYMLIASFDVTDLAGPDGNEFEYTMSIVIDTRSAT